MKSLKNEKILLFSRSVKKRGKGGRKPNKPMFYQQGKCPFTVYLSALITCGIGSKKRRTLLDKLKDSYTVEIWKGGGLSPFLIVLWYARNIPPHLLLRPDPPTGDHLKNRKKRRRIVLLNTEIHWQKQTDSISSYFSIIQVGYCL